MRIWADKSGLEMHYATFGYASLWLMQRGGGHGEPAPTAITLAWLIIYNNSYAFQDTFA